MEWFLKKRRYNKGRSIPFDVVISTESNPALMSAMYNAGLAAHANYMTLRECLTVANGQLENVDFSAVETFEEFNYFVGITRFTPTTNSSSILQVSSISIPITLIEGGSVFKNATIDDFDTKNMTTIGILNGRKNFAENVTFKNFRLRDKVTSSYIRDYKPSTPRFYIENLYIDDLSKYLNINPGYENNSVYSGKMLISGTDNVYLKEGNSYNLVTSVTIPSDITTIKPTTFEFYEKLTAITISSSITTIDCEAFKNCTGLTTINVQGLSGITVLGINFKKDAFVGCTALNSFNASVQGLLSSTFENNFANPIYYTKHIQTAPNAPLYTNQWCDIDTTISDGNYTNWGDQHTYTQTSIPAYCFNNLEIDSLAIRMPNCTSIGDYAFLNSTIKNLYMGLKYENVSINVSVGQKAFMNCANLLKLHRINLTGSIGTLAFYGCTNLELNIPSNSSITFIGTSAFSYCKCLENIVLTGINNIQVSIFWYSNIKSLEVTNMIPTSTQSGMIDWFRETYITKAIFNSGTWQKGCLNHMPYMKKVHIKGTIASSGGAYSNPTENGGIRSIRVLIFEPSTSFGAQTTFIFENLTTSYFICKATSNDFDFTNITFTNNSNVVLVHPDNPSNASFYAALTGFAHVYSVTEYNAANGTSHADINALATALWEDTNLN